MSTGTAALAWHYTTGEKFLSIEASGFLRPSSIGAATGERAVLWFSLNQSFEPTATKGLVDAATGQRRNATMAEMVDLGGGLVRFGIPARDLLTGEKLRTRARISRAVWAALARAGAAVHADPALWFGSLSAVDVAACVVEVMNASGAWVRARADAQTETQGSAA